MNPDAKQVVTIAPDGVISSLRRKDGLDLRQFGNIEIQRISDIKWCNDKQKWYIEIIAGPLKGKILNYSIWASDSTCGAFFKEYEEAVEAEIISLDTLRKHGVF